jgi:hypothetical protein
MIIHSYLTDGLFGWAKLFVESYRFHNGEDIPIHLCTRNLTELQVKELYELYPNIKVENKDIDLKLAAKQLGLTMEQLLKYKARIEKVGVTNRARIWKQFISADDRIRSIYEVMKQYPEQDFMLHTDIDSYVRGPLTRIFDCIRNNEISIRFRPNNPIDRRVLGALVGFKLNDKVYRFMEHWIKYLDDVPIPKRQRGYGQTSFYLAYKDLYRKYKWGNFPLEVSGQRRKPDEIWAGKGDVGKDRNLKFYLYEFDMIKKGETWNDIKT